MEQPKNIDPKVRAKIKPRSFDRSIFQDTNEAALKSLEHLCKSWNLDGRKQGAEFVALNPTRSDNRLGSFRINLHTGRWADFATGDKGGDPISFYAYIFGMTQIAAARELARDLGVRS